MSLIWKLIVGVLGLSLGASWPPPAHAITAVFYQPQLRDMSVAADRWPQAFDAVHGMGVDTLVVQWTRYGAGFSDVAAQAWLANRIRDARAAGLSIILGLQADPAFFERQQQSEAALAPYLADLRRDDIADARKWTKELGPGAISGWYLPAEIDDQRWREPSARTLLAEHLRAEAQELREVADKPVFASSFFTGRMAPSAYVEMLTGLAGSGVRIWVQDGAGTRTLSAVERGLYLAPLEKCVVPTAGFVFEIFRQVGPDQAFSAQPLPAGEAASAMRQRAPCARDSVFFELRYLPGIAGLPPP